MTASVVHLHQAARGGRRRAQAPGGITASAREENLAILMYELGLQDGWLLGADGRERPELLLPESTLDLVQALLKG
jgi:hypothetical protein